MIENKDEIIEKLLEENAKLKKQRMQQITSVNKFLETVKKNIERLSIINNRYDNPAIDEIIKNINEWGK